MCVQKMCTLSQEIHFDIFIYFLKLVVELVQGMRSTQDDNIIIVC